ncbi:MAG: rod shape-determining protein RodA, partial [Alphaproteobacteria bacterium]|nr:rod shape-determining protein RodA [Alphaproteobacteria bacterium]
MLLHHLRIKLSRLNWPIFLLIHLIAAIGFMTLYSAGGGELYPWASRQLIRFGVGIIILMVVALSDMRVWYHYAYTIYAFSFALLIGV